MEHHVPGHLRETMRGITDIDILLAAIDGNFEIIDLIGIIHVTSESSFRRSSGVRMPAGVVNLKSSPPWYQTFTRRTSTASAGMLVPCALCRLGTLIVIPDKSFWAVIMNEPASNSLRVAVRDKVLPGAAGTA